MTQATLVNISRQRRWRPNGRPILMHPEGLIVCFLLLFVSTPGPAAWAWMPSINQRIAADLHRPSLSRIRPSAFTSPATATVNTPTRLWGWFDALSPFESKIPPELRDEIYKAEANTAAAKDRGQRIVVYTCLAVLGILLAVFNGFLTELRSHEEVIAGSSNGNLDVLVDTGFGWVVSNPLFSFLFTNAIGGGLCLLLGGGAGLMAEAEMDTKRLNSEKIYEELVRRREQKIKQSNKSSSGAASSSSDKKKKNRRSGKEQKRLDALAEVAMAVDGDEAPTAATDTELTTVSRSEQLFGSPDVDNATETTDESTNDDKGLFDQMKSLYEKADSMAASQALLLNKKLEDSGLVSKITDETGLRIIGREAAAKKQEDESNAKTTQKQDS